MNVLVTGATGFIGHGLVMRLLGEGHRVTAVSRHPRSARARLGTDPEVVPSPEDAEAAARLLEGHDALIHLAGEPIAGRRWTRKRRAEARHSRIASTDLWVAGMARAARRPSVFVCASAIGIYGHRGDEWLSEDSAVGDGFLATLCQDWEEAASRAANLGVRVVIPRIGLVLGRHGGMLGALEPLFRLGLGGPLGHGRQFMSWIHLDDLLQILVTSLTDSRYRGPVNAVAPEPVSNGSFVAAYARILSRPAFLPAPRPVLALLLGEGAGALTASQRVRPAALRQLGFRFRFEDLSSALQELHDPRHEPELRRLSPKESGPDSPYVAERGAKYELKQRVIIDAPLNEVFEFFSRAENLGAITPPGMSFAIQTPTPLLMKKGLQIDYTIRLGPAPMRWRTRIDVWEPGRRFVDVQLRGPYRSWWHEHRFEADGERTIMSDRVLYRPPLGLLGRIANRLFIRRTLQTIFGYRTAVIARRFGAVGDARALAA